MKGLRGRWAVFLNLVRCHGHQFGPGSWGLTGLLVLALVGCASRPPSEGDWVSPYPAGNTVQESPVEAKEPANISRIEPTPDFNREPTHPAANQLIDKARRARFAGNLVQSLALLERAQRIAPNDANIYLELAETYQVKQQPQQQQQMARKALALAAKRQWIRQRALQLLKVDRAE